MSCGLTGAAEPARSVRIDFAADVYPILQRACFECHGTESQEADLRLDDRASTLASGIVVPGNPDDSELLRRISLPRGHSEAMPAAGDPLTKRQIATIRHWILDGADWPKDFRPGLHWAYVPPVRPKLPAVSDPQWPANAIDRFVLSRLDEEQMQPSPPADPEQLIRRVYLDLIGLPPSPAELDMFLSNPSLDAYQQVVDALLSRPQFGERWARPWLDLARYADSHGYQRDDLREIWPYRDWVIRALNADMPFDQFTIEQIAGDLLPEPTEDQKIATGFHRCAPTNVEAGSLVEETRTSQVIDRVNTTATVWLGTTLACAQCHDHKYDPFTNREYYQFLAFFNNTKNEVELSNPKVPSSIRFIGPSMPLADPLLDAQRKKVQRQLAAVQNRAERRKQELSEDLAAWIKEQVVTSEAAETETLKVIDFQSSGASDESERLPDGSVLLLGENPPDRVTYTVRARVTAKTVRAFRVEALTDDRLPGKGPGRGDPVRSNFVLNEFTVCEGDDPSGTPLQFASAHADFSQKNWDVAGAVDGKPKTGWAIAPQFGRPHWAAFVLKEPIAASGGRTFTFRLDQNFGSGRVIGRLKLVATSSAGAGKVLPSEITGIAGLPESSWLAEDREAVLNFRAENDSEMRALSDRAAKLQTDLEKLAPQTTLAMVELDKPRQTHVFQRGDYRHPGEPVQPDTPSVLHDLPEGPPNRLALARWLVDPKNPLVARVTVNRLWAEVFGTGIVSTAEDFGIKGERPSHPRLLDWLAVEFAEHNWSVKHILRTIVLSATYRQSSAITPELAQTDPENRLLARGPRFRMDAEMIRDNALAVSGLLSLKQGGPPIHPYQPEGVWRKVGGTNYEYVVDSGEDRYRRGIYVVLKRGSPYPSFINFDATARLACSVKRSRTNTPLQALTLLNDPVYVECAAALARRILNDCPDAGLDGRLSYGFRLCTSRVPTASEINVLRSLYEEQLQQRDDPATSQTNERDALHPAGVSAIEFNAWKSVSTALLNLHETITKE